jgi:hypothetical protein
MLVSSPVIVHDSIFKGQLPGPAFGNRLIHFLNRYRFARPVQAALKIFD